MADERPASKRPERTERNTDDSRTNRRPSADKPSTPRADKPAGPGANRPDGNANRQRAGRDAATERGGHTDRDNRVSRTRSTDTGRSRRSDGGGGRTGGAASQRVAARWTLRDYVLQLSVVIVGILVTFVGSDLIGRWSRQQQVRRVMHLVVAELEQNRELLLQVCDGLRYDRQGMLMLHRYAMDVEAVPLDSLERYRNMLSRLYTFRPQQDAQEVLKSSELIAAVRDKELLVELLGCYNRLNDFRDGVMLYGNFKMEAQNHLFAHSKDFYAGDQDLRRVWRAMLSDPVCGAFLGTSAYFFGFGDDFGEQIASVERTIDRIKNEYRFK